MRLLLLSNSTCYQKGYLEHAMGDIKDFLGDSVKRVLFIPYAGVTFGWGAYTRKVGERYQEVVLRDGGMLRSGAGLKIVFQTSREAHVYALLLDSAGKASVIFPGDDFELANRVKAGKQVELPPGDLWFFLDDQPGTETIYVLASLKPMPQIAALATRLEAMGAGRDDRVADREVAEFVSRGAVKRRKKKKKKKRPILIAGVVRGIGGVKKGSVTRVKLSDGSEVKQAQEMLTGEGAVVRALSFRHE